VVAGHSVDHAGFEEGTGYRLDQWHVGLVVWTAAPVSPAGVPVGTAVDEHRALESFVRRLAGSLSCARAPLVTAVDRSTAWAWLPVRAVAGATRGRSLDLTAVRAFATNDGRLRLTLGVPARGEAGFRRTHEQAQQARSVALMAGDRAPAAVSIGDEGVAIVAMMAQDLARTRAWVAEVLGRLAVDGQSTTALRETMRVFLLTGENYSRTADLLVLHRNTVKYRVSKVLEERGGSVDANRLDVALALQACHLLGAAVLQPSPKAARGNPEGGSPRGRR
jgi:PucR C-terminal helix-turn-helix domain/GGDEF-like domain